MAKTVELPTFYPAQVEAFKLPGRFKAVRCGRRWGKTDFGKTIACDGAIQGESIGWFSPDYKIQSEAYNEIVDILEPVIRRSSKTEGVIRTITKGRIDFWTLENERAGRSRKYHKIIIDEAAFTKPNMMSIWEKSIKPTLLDYVGSAVVLSNTNGIASDNFFWQICNDPSFGFVQYHGPTFQNPYLPLDELAKLEKENHPLVFKQEYLAEFVDWAGVQFFNLENMLEAGNPVAYFKNCDAVFATIDTAVKAGRDHDSTAVTFWAYSKYEARPLMVLDWDIVKIEGDLLVAWLPTIFQRLEELARSCGARQVLGAFIEDKASGSILLQQAKRRGWPATAISSTLTSVGKDERAISVSGYVYQNKVTLSAYAHEKTKIHNEQSRNHFMTQVFGFRIGVKDQDDDLFDTFCYGIAIALGNYQGQ